MEAAHLKEAPTEADAYAPPKPAPGKPRSPKRAFLALGTALIAVLAGIGVYAYLTRNQVDTDDATVEAEVVAISARVPGVVASVAVADNQPVKKGQIIATLDDSQYAARLEQAKAGLQTAQAMAQAADAQVRIVAATARGGFSSARAMLSGSSAQVETAAAQVAAAKAGLDRAKAGAAQAKLALGRAKELRAANAVPQAALDNAQLAFDAAQAALSGAQAQLQAAEHGQVAAKTQVDAALGRLGQTAPIDARIAAARANAAVADARVQSAQAALDLATLEESYTKIHAPADGVASKVSARVGALLQPGQPIAELVPNETYVVANFKETQIGRMRPGDRADIDVDTYGRTFEGTVASLSGGTGASFSLLPADNASGNFVKVVQRVPVRIVWKRPPDLPMRAGLSAEVTVYFGK